MDKDMSPDLDPEKLTRLLGITFDYVSNDAKNTAIDTDAQTLEALLVGTLALDTTVLYALPTVIGQLDKDILPGGGTTLGEVLTNPKSDLDMIKKIKRYAKRVSSRKDSEAEHTVAVVIYYAAIAHALLFHKAKITTHPYKTLRAHFERLSAKPWMSKELSRLFTEVRQCDEMAKAE